MSLITNIKYHYHKKILQDLLSTNNYHDFFRALSKQKNHKKLYIKLLLEFLLDAIKNPNFDVLPAKITWVNSFMKQDATYIKNFLRSYVHLNDQTQDDVFYEHQIVRILKETEDLQKITFNDFINFSFMYQYLILDENKNPLQIIANHLPFFSTPKNLNFTNSHLTQCYFYIVDHPYTVYEKLKISNNNDLNSTRSYFLNVDSQTLKEKINGVDVEINKMGWHTHFGSWTSPNVINALKGKVILKKDLINNTFDTLSSIILHLIQSGADIKIDYEFIEKYVSNNKIEPLDNNTHSISQKEKKFIDNYVGNILESYNF